MGMGSLLTQDQHRHGINAGTGSRQAQEHGHGINMGTSRWAREHGHEINMGRGSTQAWEHGHGIFAQPVTKNIVYPEVIID